MNPRPAPASTHGLLVAPADSKAHGREVLAGWLPAMRVQGLAAEYGLIVCRDKDGAWGVWLERHDDGPIPRKKQAELAALLDLKDKP